MRSNNRSKNIIIIALFIAIIGGISFGYAQLKETLTINGNATIKSAKWNVNLRNLQLNDTSTGTSGEPTFVIDSNNTVEITKDSTTIERLKYGTDSESNPTVTVEKLDNNGGLILHFAVTFKEPNQVFSFKFDISNNGTLDAKLTGIKEDNVSVQHVQTPIVKKEETTSTEPYFRYTISGMPALDNASTIDLPKGTSKTVTVLLEAPDLSDAANLPSTDYTFEKTIELQYSQK